MNKLLRHILTGVFAILMLAYLVVTLTSSSSRFDSLPCKGLKVIVKDSTRISFVTADEVKGYLDSEMPGYAGMLCKDLDLEAVEGILDGKSAVLKSEAFITKDGVLNVRITQREPLARFQNGPQGFYADRDGCIFPLQKNFTARVPVVDGNIPVSAPSGFKGKPEDPASAQWLDEVISLVIFIRDSRTWSRDIAQISVSQNGDLILIPKEGKEKFIFGKPDDVERKFKRMETYYCAVKPSREEGYYSTVNVKYDGQIICRR